MTNVYVFTAATDTAQANWSRSIRSSISPEVVFDSFVDEQHSILSKIEQSAGGFYAWGAQAGEGRNVGYWEKMEPGDFVLGAFSGQYRCIARVLGRFHNEKFAKNVWASESGAPLFEYMYFLSEPELIRFDYDHADDYLSKGYRGFVKVSDAKAKSIRREFGSISNFLVERFGVRNSDLELSIGEEFLAIAELWPDYRANQRVDSGHDCYKKVVESVPSIIRSKVSGFASSFRVHGSTGAGLTTAAPWIAVFNRSVTESATSGFYPVYLYATDMRTLFLCIELGAEQFTKVFGESKGREKIRDATAKLRPLFEDRLPDFASTEEIDLASEGSKLHEGYEDGSIYQFAKYEVESMPPDDMLISDLVSAVKFYELMVSDPLMPSVDDLVVSALDVPEPATIPSISVVGFSPRPLRKRKGGASSSGSSGPRRSKESAKVGLAGEELVFEEERRKLRELGLERLADQVQPHYKNAEYPGWDITSFDADGAKIFIEVKSSKSKTISSIELTANEWAAAQQPENQGRYCLYLVTNVLSASPAIEKLENPASFVEQSILRIEPSTYLLSLRSLVTSSK